MVDEYNELSAKRKPEIPTRSATGLVLRGSSVMIRFETASVHQDKPYSRQAEHPKLHQEDCEESLPLSPEGNERN
jgi:hypothetical protein